MNQACHIGGSAHLLLFKYHVIEEGELGNIVLHQRSVNDFFLFIYVRQNTCGSEKGSANL